MMPVLELKGLGVSLRRGGRDVPVLDRISLAIAPGEMAALVGESGSGKSVTALAVMRLLPEGALLAGQILLEGEDIAQASESRLRALRGKRAAMVFQNPLAALNPTRTVAAQIGEVWRMHEGGGRRAARARALDLLAEVGIPDPAARLDDYPHQFSGGMRQRVMIAMALACAPRLLIADEPTAGLDPPRARQIMELLARLRRERDMAVLFVTHDLALVEREADAIHVLYAGEMVEWGAARAFFAHPRHPYSEALLGAVPHLGQARLRSIPGSLPEPEARPPGCRFAPRCARAEEICGRAHPPADGAGNTVAACFFPLPAAARTGLAAAPAPPPRVFPPLLEIKGLSVRYPGPGGWLGRRRLAPALEGISLTLGRGECLGVVGESGSGKSTLGRAVLQMIGYEGEMSLEGESLARMTPAARRAARRRLQPVFQDPRESLNPRMRVGEIIAEPLRLQGGLSRAARAARVEALLAQVGLSAAIAARYPGAVSGGQAQRIAIARALAPGPALVVLDEPGSALDVSTQAMLLNLLKDLGRRHGLTYLFISHDLAAVSTMADRIAVLRAGRMIELAETAALIAQPRHEYTRALIAAAAPGP
jgi:oligopeptide/dipeptide ABC transporter ATP-binding protein